MALVVVGRAPVGAHVVVVLRAAEKRVPRIVERPRERVRRTHIAPSHLPRARAERQAVELGAPDALVAADIGKPRVRPSEIGHTEPRRLGGRQRWRVDVARHHDFRPAKREIRSGYRDLRGERTLELHARLPAHPSFDGGIDRGNRRHETVRKAWQHPWKSWRVCLAERKHGHLVAFAVALQRVGHGAQRDAIEVEPGARAHDCPSIPRRPRHTNARGDVVPVGLNRVGEILHVVPEAAANRERVAGTPFILHEAGDVGVRLPLVRFAKRLLKRDVGPRLKRRQRRECIRAGGCAGKSDDKIVVEKIEPPLQQV
jgi:hypothetical protein